MRTTKIIASAGVALFLALTITASTPVDSDSTPSTRMPVSISALGDSITEGFNSCGLTAGPCLDNSWATGKSKSSIVSRLKEANPTRKVKSWNNSQFGSTMKDLPAQAELAAMQQPELVTILAGANDLCTYKTETMTTAESLEQSFSETLKILTTKLPDSRIFVASIPNIAEMAKINQDNPDAQRIWSSGAICNLALNEPNKEERAKNLTILNDRVIETNQMLQQVCSTFKHCYSDNSAVYKTNLESLDLSTIDYFHPSKLGQDKLANVVWRAMPQTKIAFKVTTRTLKGDPDKAPNIQVLSPKNKSTVTGEVLFKVAITTPAEYIQPEKVYLKTPIGSYDLKPILDDTNKDLKKTYWGFSIDSTLAPNGTEATVTVIAVDNIGNVSESTPVTATVWNPTATQ